MRPTSLAVALAALPAAALGHEGPHLHPHGAEFGLGAMFAAAAGAAVTWLLLRRR